MASQRMSPLTWLGVALVVAIALMVILGVLSFSTYGGYYGMMGSGSWGWALLMMGIPAVILIVILLAALGGLREPAGYPVNVPPSQNPLEILEQRYARGELTREDYLKIRDDLAHGPSHS
ncbi:MAG TPA: hypothetical protein HA326_05050 [Thermoplasmata archaeon]|nr:hypothetical protein [Thermoplasmata archaeon]